MAKKTHPLKEKRILQLRAEGLSMDKIAKQTKVSKATVVKVLQRNQPVASKTKPSSTKSETKQTAPKRNFLTKLFYRLFRGFN